MVELEVSGTKEQFKIPNTTSLLLIWSTTKTAYVDLLDLGFKSAELVLL